MSGERNSRETATSDDVAYKLAAEHLTGHEQEGLVGVEALSGHCRSGCVEHLVADIDGLQGAVGKVLVNIDDDGSRAGTAVAEVDSHGVVASGNSLKGSDFQLAAIAIGLDEVDTESHATGLDICRASLVGGKFDILTTGAVYLSAVRRHVILKIVGVNN